MLNPCHNVTKLLKEILENVLLETLRGFILKYYKKYKKIEPK